MSVQKRPGSSLCEAPCKRGGAGCICPTYHSKTLFLAKHCRQRLHTCEGLPNLAKFILDWEEAAYDSAHHTALCPPQEEQQREWSLHHRWADFIRLGRRAKNPPRPLTVLLEAQCNHTTAHVWLTRHVSTGVRTLYSQFQNDTMAAELVPGFFLTAGRESTIPAATPSFLCLKCPSSILGLFTFII